jgi:hypothetical protein
MPDALAAGERLVPEPGGDGDDECAFIGPMREIIR